MILWVLFGIFLFLAVAFVVWPLYSGTRKFDATIASATLVIVATSASLYYANGSPGLPSASGALPDPGEMVASLRERLKKTPEDINGWLLLGRSEHTLKNFDASIVAYEKAMELEDGRNAQTLVSLALVVVEANDGALSPRASGLLEKRAGVVSERSQRLVLQRPGSRESWRYSGCSGTLGHPAGPESTTQYSRIAAGAHQRLARYRACPSR